MTVGLLGLVAAIVSLALTVALAYRVAALTSRLSEAENALAARTGPRPSELPATSTAPRPLEGLRVAVEISQDHAHAVFATLLKEMLLREDVAEIRVVTQTDHGLVQREWQERKQASDVLISGRISCNGYAEVYYQAEFTCFTPSETICTLIERPPGGDRPENLALELVSRLSSKLEESVRRNERRTAIGELRGL